MFDRSLKLTLFLMSLFLISPAFAVMLNPDAPDVAQAEETQIYTEENVSSESEEGGLEITMSDDDKERWERTLRVLEMKAEEEARTGEVIQVKSSASQKKSCSKYTGGASFYANKFQGRKTASGQRFDQGQRTAAHKQLPFGTVVRVKNLKNGKSTTVRVNDRGPFIKGRIIDLSKVAAKDIGMIQSGHAKVEIEVCSK